MDIYRNKKYCTTQFHVGMGAVKPKIYL